MCCIRSEEVRGHTKLFFTWLSVLPAAEDLDSVRLRPRQSPPQTSDEEAMET